MSAPGDFQLHNGTVIDHLPVGTGAEALRLLGLPRQGPVTVGLHVPSARLGHKDILRVEGTVLAQPELDRLALLGDEVTVCQVEAGVVVRKRRLQVPARLDGILDCPNTTCISREPAVQSVFHRAGEGARRFRCHYCERLTTPR